MVPSKINSFILCLLILVESAFTFNLTILHTNDVGARMESFNIKGMACSKEDETKNQCFGGVARRLTALNQYRENNENVVFLDGGDQYQGSLYYTFLGWKPIAEVMEKMKYDAMSFGNHEFDDGLEGLTPFLQAVKNKFHVLATNLESEDPDFSDGYQQSAVVTVGSEKIGLLGYITPETPTIANPGPHLSFKPEVPALRKAVDELKLQNVNIIIAVGHSGHAVDKKICREVDGIDVVIGGHSNTFLYKGTPPSTEVPADTYPVVIQKNTGDKCLVVQDYAFGKYLGVLHVDFDEEGRVSSWSGNPVLVDNKFPPDSEMSESLVKYSKELEVYKLNIIGQTASGLDGSRTDCRQRECNLGNLIADAIVYAFQKPPEGNQEEHWAKAAAAVINGGGIRNSLQLDPWSNITQGDLYTVMPFGGVYSEVYLLGKFIRQAFEHSISFVFAEDLEGGFLQVSGFKVIYDEKRPAGSRVVSLKIRCADCAVPKYEDVDNNKEYCLILGDYLQKGGNGYSVISKNARKGREYDLQLVDIDIVTTYIEHMQPVRADIEGRSIRLSEDNVVCAD